MSTIFTFETEDLSNFANCVKECLLENMKKDGTITKEEAEEWAKTYIVSISKPYGLGKYIRNLFGSDDSYRIFVTKTIPKIKDCIEFKQTSISLKPR